MIPDLGDYYLRSRRLLPQPFLTDVRTGAPSMIPEWREISLNFFIDNYSPQVPRIQYNNK